MGKEKYQTKVAELFTKSPVVSFDSIERMVTQRKQTTQYTKQFIRNLLLKGKIYRLAKGCYSKSDDPSLSVFCFHPSYLGLQDSLGIHNVWEQETIPIIITSKKVRPGLRKTPSGNILIKRIDKKYMFGISYKKS